MEVYTLIDCKAYLVKDRLFKRLWLSQKNKNIGLGEVARRIRKIKTYHHKRLGKRVERLKIFITQGIKMEEDHLKHQGLS